MRLFKITNPATGVNLGTYAGDTKARALDNYAYTAGYADFAAACAETGDDPGDDAGLCVVEVVPPTFPSLSFDGIGVNGRDKYRTRIATLNRDSGMTINERDDLGRLFAAAPDLLAALRAIASIPKQDEPEEEGSEYRQDWSDFDGAERARGALFDAIDRARTAIRAATGDL